MKNKISLIVLLLLSAFTLNAADVITRQVIWLSGKDNLNTKTWEFFCTAGRKSGVWTTIEVPSCWEQQGFGNYEYGRNSYSYGQAYKYANEKGLYRLKFNIPAEWKDREIKIIFDGVMTDAEVKINGQPAGPVHQGGFYQFTYNITKLVFPGKENQLEVTVSKLSSDESVNRAERYGDYWNFGGIFRPVRLESFPRAHIARMAADAKADGLFTVHAYTENITGGLKAEAFITDSKGVKIATATADVKAGDSLVIIKGKAENPLLWTSETPSLYKLTLNLVSGKKIIYTASEKIGFRTVEVRHSDGIYLNGTKVKLKGINRHSFWPESGRTLSYQICLNDVKLMKEMNMNAVRMSHYPPDSYFLDICDSLGLYVLDEIAGWQRAYDTPIGKKIVKETVIRDVNHPSVIFWDNGNEGGTNKELDREFLKWDPQARDVLHPHHRPGNAFNGIDCNHYEPYQSAVNLLKDTLIYMPTEFLHCQDDGGGGSGLEDYWELLWTSERSGGGFLWALVDEGLSRSDMNGFIDTDGVNGPDGVLGPHREKEGSFYAIRQIFSPVHITLKKLPEGFDGTVEVENRYHFTNLSKCAFSARLAKMNGPREWLTGHSAGLPVSVGVPDVKPLGKGVLKVELPQGWQDYDVLELTAKDPSGDEIYTWSWQVRPGKKILSGIYNLEGNQEATGQETDSLFTLRASGTTVVLNTRNGKIERVTYGGRTMVSFGNGPVITTGNARVTNFRSYSEPDGYVAEFTYSGDMKTTRWKMYRSGWLSLEYSYEVTGPFHYAGISFSYPENWVIRAKWLGDGPSRVWKNRPGGVTYNVREKVYNNTQTGAYPFFYPEFKGYFSNFTWLELSTAQGKVFIGAEDDGLYLRLYDFYGITGPKSYPELPKGDISILDCIPPLGSKLATGLTTDASVYGPAGKLTEMNGVKQHKLWFYFGIPVMQQGKGDNKSVK